MLISRKHRFIFIHIYKNAGTSIKKALLPFASDKWQFSANMILKKFNIRYFDPQPSPPHISASELITKLGDNVFKTYFSFAIVRNPWDFQASLYTYAIKTPKHKQHDMTKAFSGFDEYIKWRCSEEIRFQKDFVYNTAGEKLVDFIGRYENLDDDFQTICSRIGVKAVLPRLNASKSKPYQEYYNEETIELVRNTFEPDIRMFNYTFD